MAVQDEIQTMKSQGINDTSISQALQEKGYSPQQINDALSQTQIKSAVTGNQPISGNPAQQNQYETSQTSNQPPIQDQTQQDSMSNQSQPDFSGMQQSTSPIQNQESSPNQNYNPNEQSPMPQTTPIATTQEMQQPQTQQDQYGYQQGYDQQYAYPETSGGENQYADQYGYEQYSQQPQIGTEIITEIAEQVTDNKFAKISKSIGNIAEFKTKIENKTENLNERLKKIETIIEKLQASILGKIGEYGQDIGTVSREIKMLQDSFTKVASPLLQKSKAVSSRTKKPATKKTKKKTTKTTHHTSRLRI